MDCALEAITRKQIEVKHGIVELLKQRVELVTKIVAERRKELSLVKAKKEIQKRLEKE